MKISHKQVETMMKEVFMQQNPIKVVGHKEQTAYIIKLYEEKFKNYPSLSTYKSSSKRMDEKEFSESISITYEPERFEKVSNYFYIRFIDNILSMEEHGNHCGISDFLEVDKFVDKLSERYAEYKKEQAKKNKIIQLKSNAIIAVFKKIAEEENVEYSYTEKTSKIVLNIRLNNRYVLNIFIPFSKFQEVIPMVQTTIRQVKSLYNNGIEFKISGNAFNTKWKKPNENV